MHSCVIPRIKHVLGTYRSENPDKGCTHKLTPDQALYEIEPAIKGLMLAVQRKMDLTFPSLKFK